VMCFMYSYNSRTRRGTPSGDDPHAVKVIASSQESKESQESNVPASDGGIGRPQTHADVILEDAHKSA